MRLLTTAFILRRFLALAIVIGAAFFGYHAINQSNDSVNRSIAQGQKAYAKSAANTAGVTVKGLPKPSTKDVHIKRSGDTLEATGTDGTKVTVKGLPTP